MTFRRREDEGTQRIELTKFEDFQTPTIYSHFDHASAPATDDDEPTNNGLLLLPVTSSNPLDFHRHASDKLAQKVDGAAAAATTSTDREQQVEVSIAVDYGCIVILVYYLQDSQLLNVKTRQSTRSQNFLRSLLATNSEVLTVLEIIYRR